MSCSFSMTGFLFIYPALKKNFGIFSPKVLVVSSWRRQWRSTLVLLPEKSHGWRSLVGCSPWGYKELDTTEQLHFHFSLSCIGEGNGNPLVLLPGESQGWRSIVGCRPWGRTESDTTEVTWQQQQQ